MSWRSRDTWLPSDIRSCALLWWFIFIYKGRTEDIPSWRPAETKTAPKRSTPSSRPTRKFSLSVSTRDSFKNLTNISTKVSDLEDSPRIVIMLEYLIPTYSLTDLQSQYPKYIHKRPKHILLWKPPQLLQCFFRCSCFFCALPRISWQQIYPSLYSLHEAISAKLVNRNSFPSLCNQTCVRPLRAIKLFKLNKYLIPRWGNWKVFCVGIQWDPNLTLIKPWKFPSNSIN